MSIINNVFIQNYMFMILLVLLREKAMMLEDERDQKECMTLWVLVVGEGAR